MKNFIKTLYAGEHYKEGRRDVLRQQLNDDGFYVLTGAGDSLQVFTLTDDIQFEDKLEAVIKAQVVQPLVSGFMKVAGYFYGR